MASGEDILTEMLSDYSENCLSHQAVHCNIVSKLRNPIRSKRPGLLTRVILFHRDNAKSHTSQLTDVIITFCLALLPVDSAARTFRNQKQDRESDLRLRARRCLFSLSQGRTKLDIRRELNIVT
ncbi:hypothetical protein AVEN_179373-1 [Araneus ventricosus]|uniref:Uncharacterized protein n=1 Tax=Araneus ventricosus TaxID=182803 RepID=A0A4Y2DJL6_ARAVE|nr:hypothetical protein AVEN_179373-1 [Araneus ventricosus]